MVAVENLVLIIWLINKYMKKEQTYEEKLYKYKGKIFNKILTLFPFVDIEDLQQEALIGEFIAKQKYCSNKGASLISFVYSYIYYSCMNFCLRKSYLIRNYADNCILAIDDYINTFKVTDTTTENKLNSLFSIKYILRVTPEKYRPLIKDYYIDGLTLEQISRKHKCSFQNIDQKIKTALQYVKERLIKDKDFYL